ERDRTSPEYASEKMSRFCDAPGSLCAPAPSFTRCTWNLKPPLVSFTEIKDPNTWAVRPEPLVLLVIAGTFILATTSGIAYLTKEKPKKQLPDIRGYWHYHVTDSVNRPSHTGKCTITVSNALAKFDGIRRYVGEERNGKRGVTIKNWPWETTWTDYGSDGWLRCEYKFKSFNGYFKLRFADDKATLSELEGTYYLLPDSFEADKPLPNATYGTVRFVRVERDQYDRIPPPEGLEVWSDQAKIG
ncbi:MAG: hypothetical protein AB7P24_01805, partial [Nitrospira sp.]